MKKIKLIRSINLSTKLWIWTMGLVIVAVLITGIVNYNRSIFVIKEKYEVILKNATELNIEMLKLQETDILDGEITELDAQRDALKIIKNQGIIDLGDNGYNYVLNSGGEMIYHPTLSGQNILHTMDYSSPPKAFIEEIIEKAKSGGGFVTYKWMNEATGKLDEKLSYVQYFEPWDWVVASSTYLSDYNHVVMSILNEGIKAFAIVLILLFFVIQLFFTELIEPLNATVTAMEALENGEHFLLTDTSRKDELGKLTRGYNRMAKAIKENEEVLLNRNEELAEANTEIQALYQQMLASEEMLRYNYDELAKYKQALESEQDNYRRVMAASNETYWQFDVAQNLVTLTNLKRKGQTETFDFSHLIDMIHEEDRVLLTQNLDGNLEVPIFNIKLRFLMEAENEVYHWHQMIGIREENLIFGSLTDIHQEVINRERIEFYAFHDPVLGLYNMDFFSDTIRNTLHFINDEEKHVLLVVGVVGYARLLNAYGKNLTDIMAFQLSAEVSAFFDTADYISTLHSGRFAVWMKCDHPDDCLVDEIRKFEEMVVERVGKFANIEMPIDLAFGATLIGSDHTETTSAISEAETAFESAVATGKFHKINWYDASLKDAKERMLTIEQQLIKALDKNEIYLVYQPQYETFDSPKIKGYEALVRWHNETLGNVPPIEFIPFSEDVGLINPIGRFVIKEAVSFVGELKRKGKLVSVSINASYKELLQNDYVSYLLSQVEAQDVSVSQIHIEITESMISEYIDIVREKLIELVALGFEVHMDDFGTGYSSLYQLGKMPVQVLKIDKSFVWAIETDDKMRYLTELIINTAHQMSLKIIAEGVETIEQYEALKRMGCDLYQGYLFSKPLKAEEIKAKI